MSRTCGTCGRTWGGRAVFCGACGELLGDGIAPVGGAGAAAGRWRHRVLPTLAAVVVLGGVVAAVPTLSIERAPPVDGEVGVPDVAALPTAPPGTRPRRTIPPPEVTCHRGEVELDCVQWSRRLAPGADADGDRGAWVVRADDRILLATEDRLEATDTTGTRVWGLDLPGRLHPVGTSGDVLVLAEPDTVMAVDLGGGDVRWTVRTSSSVWGEVVHEDVVYTGAEVAASAPAVVARDPRTGTVRWAWPLAWDNAQVRTVAGDRLVVQSPGSTGLVVLDARTGRELGRAEDRRGWVLDVVDDVAIVVAPRASEADPSGPNPAGDPGATIEGIDLRTGSRRWTRDVRALDVGFEVASGLVLAPSARRLTAMDAATGDVAWEVDVPGTVAVAHHWATTSWPPDPGRPTTAVVTFDPADGTVRRYDRHTGAIIWEQSLEGPVFHAAVHADVVIAFDPTGAAVLDAATGRVSLRIDTAGGGLVSRTPYVVHDHETGYVTLLDVAAVGPS